MLRIKNVVRLDLTELTEETAKTIERIDNCVTALFSEKTAPLLAKLPIGSMVKSVVIPEGGGVTSVNGVHTIGKADADGEKRFLLINGKLIIRSDVTAEQLSKTICGAEINGTVLCSYSQEQALGALGMHVNGKIQSYPDGAVVHEKDMVIDEAFIKSAEEGSIHYVSGDIIAFDADFAAIKAKNITLLGKSMVVYADKAAQAQALFGGNIIVIEHGCKYVKGDITLDYAALKRFGKHIAVAGNVFISDDLDAKRLNDNLEKLFVYGELICREEILDDVLEKAEEFKDLTVYQGRLIKNEGNLTLSKASLEGLNESVSIWSEGNLEIAGDVDSGLFAKKILGLYISGNVEVPAALHGRALALAKKMDGQIECLEEEKNNGEETPDGITVIDNAVNLKLV